MAYLKGALVDSRPSWNRMGATFRRRCFGAVWCRGAAFWFAVRNGLGFRDCSPGYDHRNDLVRLSRGACRPQTSHSTLSRGCHGQFARCATCVASLLLFSSAAAVACAQTSTQDTVSNLVKMHEAWGSKASTPNATLVLMESARSGQVIKFTLTTTGMPKDDVYTLVSWPVTQRQPSEVLKGVTLDASGLAICVGTPGTCSANKPNDPIDVNLRPIPGEPVRLGLVSADGATKVFAKVVPVPLRGEDRGCSVEATLLTPGAELVLIEGLGFPSNGDITMNSESEGERHSAKGKAGADGRYTSALLPHKQGVAQGTTKVSLETAKCAPSVNVQWGRRN
jgi:hypothetical protein